MSDPELVRRAIGGDDPAFELLVRRHQDAVWRMAVAILGSVHDAEEALQETFLRAFRGLASFRREAEFRTWLLAIGRRACSDSLRHRANVVPLEQAQRMHAPEAPPEDRYLIRATLEAMPGDERTAFVLVDVLGLSREEAAGVEGIPATTLKSRLYRARARLVEALTATDEAEGRTR